MCLRACLGSLDPVVQARASGTYAARVMVGEADELALGFNFELFTHTTTFFGQKVILLGLYNGQKLENEPEADVVMYTRSEYHPEPLFIRVLLLRGRMMGAVLIGDTVGAAARRLAFQLESGISTVNSHLSAVSPFNLRLVSKSYFSKRRRRRRANKPFAAMIRPTFVLARFQILVRMWNLECGKTQNSHLRTEK